MAERGLIYPEGKSDRAYKRGRETPGNGLSLALHVSGQQANANIWDAHEAALGRGDTLLYSAAAFWGKQREVMPAIADGRDARVIVYLRPQTELMGRAYSAVRARRDYSGSIEEYFEEARPEMHYLRKIEEIESWAGPMIVRPYNAVKGEGLIPDFLAQIGVDNDTALSVPELNIDRPEPVALPGNLRQRIIDEYAKENAEIERRYFAGENWLALT
ncbi:hypothetical protein [Euryhalocaulis caribicus]|uniref:hypothetical protein n=1 Tax=Euryhalocaulis caribicus TaxID=1161401 RepID=UPI0003B49538|nr:hypothetical protein [Euryhalocaulis caribicus]